MEVVAQTDPKYPKVKRSSALECTNWRLRLTLTSNNKSNGKHMQSSNSSSPARSWADWRQHVRPPKLRPVETQALALAFSSELTMSPATDTDIGPSSSTSSFSLASSCSSVSTTRLYVGNLPYAAQPSDVFTVFTEAGFDSDDFRVNMSTDPMTGRNPSFCFVEMCSIDEANKAIQEVNGKDIMGRKVKVNVAAPPRRDSTSSDVSAISHSSGGGGSGSSIFGEKLKLKTKSSRRPWSVESVEDTKTYTPTFDRWRRPDASSHWQTPVSEGRRIFVGGLPRMEPQSAVDAAIQSLFSSFQLEAVSKIISPIPPSWASDRDRYYLFVDMKNKEEVEEAIKQLNGTTSPWGKGRITVNKAKEGKGRKVVREQGLDGSGSSKGKN